MVGVPGERLGDSWYNGAGEPLRLPRVKYLPRLASAYRDSSGDDHIGHRDKIELTVQRGDHSDQDPRYAVHHRLRDILHKGLEPHALYPAAEAAARSGGGDTSIVRTA